MTGEIIPSSQECWMVRSRSPKSRKAKLSREFNHFLETFSRLLTHSREKYDARGKAWLLSLSLDYSIDEKIWSLEFHRVRLHRAYFWYFYPWLKCLLSTNNFRQYVSAKKTFLPCSWPCRRRICVSGWSPAGRDTSPTPPGSRSHSACSSHLRRKETF